MKVVPRKEIARRWQEWGRRRIESARRKHENRVKGLDLVLRLDDGRKLEFRGRQYGVPPIPWHQAIEIVALQERLEALRHNVSPGAIKESKDVFSQTARLFKRLVRPEHWFRRLAWRFTPSPIDKASPVEVAMVLGFFCRFLTMDAAGLTLMPASLQPGTSRSTRRASSRGSQDSAQEASGTSSDVADSDPSRGRRS